MMMVELLFCQYLTSLYLVYQILSLPQIYRIGTMLWDDKYGTQGLSPEVSIIPYLNLLIKFALLSK